MEERAARLLLKAVRSLPQREQDQVLTALFRSVFAPAEPSPLPFTPPVAGPDVILSQPASFRLSPPSIGAPGESTMLPVRLPPELHERLRAWSTEQGFSMAGVVRGLVERFLDQQVGRATKKRPAAARRTKRTTARG
jgi:hypothetical protein